MNFISGLLLYFCYGISNSSGEYRMQGIPPPDINQSRRGIIQIGTIFDSDSEDEIYSQSNSHSKWAVNPYTL